MALLGAAIQRGVDASKPASGDASKAGQLYFSTDTGVLWQDNGSSWLEVGTYASILAAIAALSSTGLVARTGSGTVAARTLTAGSAKLAVTNGSGASGNPTVDLGSVASTDLSDGAGLYKSGGTDVAVADGGTGASSASAARTNLGLAIGTDVEAHDADLTAIAGLSPSNDDVLQRKAGAWANRTLAQLKADLSLNPLTTQDDLYIGGASGAPARLGKGTDGQVLTVDPTTHHLVWATPSGGSLPTGGAVNAALVKRTAADGETVWRTLPAPAPHDPTKALGDILYRDPATVTSLAVGFIGDSITELTPSGGTASPAQVATLLSVHAITATAANQGQSGSKTADWLPAAGSGYLTAAKAAFATAGVRLVHIMLGTNDSKTSGRVSVATYRSNMLAIVENLVAAGYLVALSYPIWNTGATSWDATSQARLVDYQAEIDSLVNGATVFLADTNGYAYFAAHPSELGDGVHPDATGATSLAGLWAAALTPYARALTGALGWQRLAIGASGTVLKSDGTRPTWDTDAIGSGSAVYPTHGSWLVDEIKPIQGTYGYDTIVNARYPVYYNTSDANGDAWELSFLLAAGSYKFSVMGFENSGGGPTLDWTLDGSALVTGQTWASGGGINTVKSNTVTVATDGNHTLRCTVNGHSGPHYWNELQKVWFRPS